MKTTARKIISVILAVLTLGGVNTVFASAAGKIGKIGDLTARCDTAAKAATAAIAYNETDKQVLYVKNGKKAVAVGSITKVLTACVASKYFKKGDVLTVGAEQNLVKSYASRAPVWSGQKLTFEQMLCAMLIPSGCDAAYAIAANTARKATGNKNMSASAAITKFASMMNAFCKEIGCKNSNFINPDGQDIKGQHTTVNDYIKIAEYAINNSLIASVVKRSSYSCKDKTGYSHKWYTTNSMVNPNSSWYYKGAVGIKTGSTPSAGGCLLCAVEENGKRLITLVVGTYYTDSDYSQRFRTTHALLKVVEPYLARRGDMNDDGKVDIDDARKLLRVVIKLDKFTDTWVADLDLNGKIEIKDARIVLRMAIGLPAYA